MNCTEFLDNYSAWVDGDADPEWGDRAAVHALTCATCGRYDEVYRRGRELLVTTDDELDVDEDAFRASLERRLIRSRHDATVDRTVGSGAPLMSLLAMTVVVLSVAWVPVLVELTGPTVELSPIQARTPVASADPFGIRLPAVQVQRASAGLSSSATRPAVLFREYAPVLEPYRAAASPPGID